LHEEIGADPDDGGEIFFWRGVPRDPIRIDPVGTAFRDGVPVRIARAAIPDVDVTDRDEIAFEFCADKGGVGIGEIRDKGEGSEPIEPRAALVDRKPGSRRIRRLVDRGHIATIKPFPFTGDFHKSPGGIRGVESFRSIA
jgi:hypothetical protein